MLTKAGIVRQMIFIRARSLAEKQLDKINIYDIYKSVNIGGIYYEDICDGENNDYYP